MLYLLGYMKGKHNEELKTKGAVLDDVKKAKKVRDTLNDAGRINRLHSSNPIFKDFSEVKTPKDGDIVLMRQAKYPVHAGIWLDVDSGGVLHCVRKGGVIFQNQISLNLAGWFIDGFYRAIK